MRFDILTLFPNMFAALTDYGITRRAFERHQASIHLWQLREFTDDAYRTVDDRPYGGGAGMVMKPQPLQKAIMAIQQEQANHNMGQAPVIYLSATGKPLTQARVDDLVTMPAITLLCGRYEGIDQRIIDLYVDDTISLGDFVVSGGELPAMMLMDALIRKLPGVIDPESVREESHAIPDLETPSHQYLLEYPHYTRPDSFLGLKVPEVLLSGNHAEIMRWRQDKAMQVTRENRPDLLKSTLPVY